MATRDIPCPSTDPFLGVVIKKIFPFLSLVWYLFTVVRYNEYLTKGSNGNAFFITANGNVSVPSWAISLVTVSPLDCFMIH